MTTEYFRYEQESVLGLVASPSSNIIVSGWKDNLVITGALESVRVWNTRLSKLEMTFTDPDNKDGGEVIFLKESPIDPKIVAVGYSDGSIRLWSLEKNDEGSNLILVFNGHKSPITTLVFSNDGSKLFSGAKDCDIILWDLIGECGVSRLKGHTSMITGLVPLTPKLLLSSSKDTLLKIWDLSIEACIETDVTHSHEVISILQSNDLLFTTSMDKVIRVFELDIDAFTGFVHVNPSGVSENEVGEERKGILKFKEDVPRHSSDRSISLYLDSSKKYLLSLGVDRSLDIFKIRSKTLTTAKAAKATTTKSSLKEVRFCRLKDCRPKSIFSYRSKKISNSDCLTLLAGTADNQVEEIVVPFDKEEEYTITPLLERHGHRGDCLLSAFSTDGTLFATASKDQVCVWNLNTLCMFRSIEICFDGVEESVTSTSSSITSLLFIEDDRLLLVGDSEGRISIIDLVHSGEVVDSIQAHTGKIRTLSLKPDSLGMISGGEDKTLKFWSFTGKISDSTFRIRQQRELSLGEEIEKAIYSPDMLYVAIATHDLTVKVFFEKDLKFYLSLYGHKLAISGIVISSDSKLLISSSADKNIKIWSLEFGDCRKSIFAHQDVITSLVLLPNNSHSNNAFSSFSSTAANENLIVSSSKDGSIKFWDVSTFEEVQRFPFSHFKEIWCLSSSPIASYGGDGGHVIVSVGKDRSIRVWRSGLESLFPEEEKERQAEEELERSMLEDNPFEVDTSSATASSKATTKTTLSLKAGERILEAIEVADEQRRKEDEHALAKSLGQDPAEVVSDPIYLIFGPNIRPHEYLLHSMERIPLPSIQEALLCLPTTVLPSFLLYLNELLKQKNSSLFAVRIIDITLRLFHDVIVKNEFMITLLKDIKKNESSFLKEYKNVLGYNNVNLQLFLNHR